MVEKFEGWLHSAALAEVFNHIGGLFGNNGDLQNAIQLLRVTYSCNPASDVIVRNLAVCLCKSFINHLQQGDLSMARNVARELLDINHGIPDIHNLLNNVSSVIAGVIPDRVSDMPIYLINLDQREDRLTECENNYSKHGIPWNKIIRVSACHVPNFGGLGCAKSHVSVISRFLSHSNFEYALVLEDDFDFTADYNTLVSTINNIDNAMPEWDIILLGGNNFVRTERVSSGASLVLECECTEAYIVKRCYAPRLLSCFAKAIVTLEKHAVRRDPFYHRLAIDQAWKRLQREDNWVLLEPIGGKQRESYSDCDCIVKNR